MMYYDTTDPYGGGGGYDGGGGTGDGGGGEPTGITGGTDPNTRPRFKPGPNGWWAWVGGVWQWMTEPAPRTVSRTV